MANNWVKSGNTLVRSVSMKDLQENKPEMLAYNLVKTVSNLEMRDCKQD